jgi:hypothetical protein
VKTTVVLVRTANRAVQMIEDVTELELIPADGTKFRLETGDRRRVPSYPVRLCVEPLRAQRKAQIVPVAGKVGTDS